MGWSCFFTTVKVATRAGLELAPSGLRSTALPIELSSHQGLEASFYLYQVHGWRNIFATTWTLSKRRYAVFRLYYRTILRETLYSAVNCQISLDWDCGSNVRNEVLQCFDSITEPSPEKCEEKISDMISYTAQVKCKSWLEQVRRSAYWAIEPLIDPSEIFSISSARFEPYAREGVGISDSLVPTVVCKNRETFPGFCPFWSASASPCLGAIFSFQSSSQHIGLGGGGHLCGCLGNLDPDCS